ncbi:MAG: hypothetical protein ACSHYF_00480 [Verrucomicrobiaceae bacterium]
MKLPFIALLLMLSQFLTAQDPAPLPPEVEPPQPLAAKPSRDIFDLATLYYNSATEAKEERKKTQNYRLAASKFDRFIRAFPNDEKAPDAWYFLALTYRQIGEPKASRTCFEVLATRWTEGKFVAGAALHLASDDYETKEWKSAATWFATLARTTDKNKVRHEALYRRFLCYNHLNEKTQLRPALDAILKDKGNPYHETAKLALARLYQQDNDNQRAFPLFAELAGSSDPAVSSDATLQAALCAQKEKDQKASLLWFKKAFEHPGLKEWRGQTQFTLMNLHYQVKSYAEVVALFEKGSFNLDAQPHLQRLIMASKSYEALGKNDQVLKLYEEISRLAPSSDTGFQAAYRILVRDHDTNAKNFAQQAEKFLNTYSEKRQEDKRLQSARLLLAQHYFEKKDHNRALQHYQSLNLALVDSSNHFAIHYNTIKCHLALDQDDESLKAIAAFEKNYPKSDQLIQLRLERAELLSKLNREDEALADYEAVLASTKDTQLQALILQRLSAIYQEKEDYAKLVATQKRILMLPGITPKLEAGAHFWMGWDDFRRKDYKSAASQLSVAREKLPEEFAAKVGPLLVRCAFQAGDLPTLEKEISALKKADPKATPPRPIVRWLGATLAKDGEYKRAWPFLHEALAAAQEKEPLIWKLFGETALATGHPADALRAANERLQLETHPFRKAESLYQKALAHTDLKQFNDARQATGDALDLHPKGELDLDLRLLAGDIDMAEKKPQEALRHYVIVESLYAKEKDRKISATEKVIAALQAIATPEAKEKLPEYQEALRKLKQ